jgi:hypothetical protein
MLPSSVVESSFMDSLSSMLPSSVVESSSMDPSSMLPSSIDSSSPPASPSFDPKSVQPAMSTVPTPAVAWSMRRRVVSSDIPFGGSATSM